jgi:GAF domain-containing protein
VVANGTGVVLPDATRDRLVSDSPAMDALCFVAYAGMPIRSVDGQVLGALCVMDDKPREWTTGELAALRDLADCVTEEIVLRTQINKLQNQ